ncbi:GcrA cell cycle regulator [Ochrobactrum sp. S46]|nr:GcrA cell cycle regulator [Ochrobactrum sp. S45]MBK0046398.1 GcrA cell cycle regulator [Ochrobactrum sp. S46]
MTTTTWTESRTESLKNLWAEGFSASQIAAQLGLVSRNAVIGKIHRLGLASRRTNTKVAARSKSIGSSVQSARKPSSVRVERTVSIGSTVVKSDTEDAMPTVSARILPIFPRVTLMELKPSSCKWPIGDPLFPEFRFCGAQTENGAPYCNYHACHAYQTRAVSSTNNRTRRR